jgi:hypothetical protein
VTVFEKNSRIGGLVALRHSRLQAGQTPDRLAHGAIGKAEGVEFRTNTFVGKEAPGKGVANDAKQTVKPEGPAKEI